LNARLIRTAEFVPGYRATVFLCDEGVSRHFAGSVSHVACAFAAGSAIGFSASVRESASEYPTFTGGMIDVRETRPTGRLKSFYLARFLQVRVA